MPYLSIVSPVYQAEKIVDKLVSEIIKSVSAITDDFEIILVEDGSKDDSWGKIVENCEKDARVKGVQLSRNFGQHYAVTAGLNECTGFYNVIMDCDLQDDPDYIPGLVEMAKNGYDIVFTKRLNRKHSFSKILFSKIYNYLFNFLSDKSYDVNVGSLVLFTERVRVQFLSVKDVDRLYIQILKWIGFSHIYSSRCQVLCMVKKLKIV